MPLLDYNCFALRTRRACLRETLCTRAAPRRAAPATPVYDRFPKEQRERCFGECNYSIHFVTRVPRLKGPLRRCCRVQRISESIHFSRRARHRFPHLPSSPSFPFLPGKPRFLSSWLGRDCNGRRNVGHDFHATFRAGAHPHADYVVITDSLRSLDIKTAQHLISRRRDANRSAKTDAAPEYNSGPSVGKILIGNRVDFPGMLRFSAYVNIRT